MEKEPDMSFGTKEEQYQLLQQVMSANEIDTEEDTANGKGSGPSRPGTSSTGSRKVGSLAALSGADDAVYYEFKKTSTAHKHPLFKKFRC